MRQVRLDRYPIAVFAGLGLVLPTIFGLGIWGPISSTLQEAHAAETRRLLESFAQPLSAALGKGDDLAKIDELKRLEKLPGVSTARIVSEPSRKSPQVMPLEWEGKTLGWLKIQVSRTAWRRFRHQNLERLWSLVIVMGLCGGAAGWRVERRRRHFVKRLSHTLQRIQARHRRARERLRLEKESEILPWTRQATAFASMGLVLLDSRQSIVAYNRKAQEHFRLVEESLGTHWLDLQSSPAWATALKLTLDHPGEQVQVRQGADAEISLLSFASPENQTGSTWIIVV